MSSGVAVNNAVLTTFSDLKIGRKYKYVIYKINDLLTEVIVDKTADSSNSSNSYDDFITDIKLVGNESRYAIYDFDYVGADGGTRNRICFYIWCPDTATAKNKLLYASTAEIVRRKLVGISAEIQGTDLSEIDHQTVLERVYKNY